MYQEFMVHLAVYLEFTSDVSLIWLRYSGGS